MRYPFFHALYRTVANDDENESDISVTVETYTTAPTPAKPKLGSMLSSTMSPLPRVVSVGSEQTPGNASVRQNGTFYGSDSITVIRDEVSSILQGYDEAFLSPLTTYPKLLISSLHHPLSPLTTASLASQSCQRAGHDTARTACQRAPRWRPSTRRPASTPLRTRTLYKDHWKQVQVM